ncbi:hypothetical protein ACIBF6_02065 [Streptosporangium amethystogenes]|uniref:hypothetical protein n=1 Tax=Streptosporangium amethystogenes TaxID=2002 RepID=UPI0037A47F18
MIIEEVRKTADSITVIIMLAIVAAIVDSFARDWRKGGGRGTGNPGVTPKTPGRASLPRPVSPRTAPYRGTTTQ